MKVACISASRIPSDTANSIQVMKACQALAQLGHQVRLLAPDPGTPVPGTPGSAAAGWEALAGQYGLTSPFEVRWLPSRRGLRRYDLALAAVRQARAWGAGLAYVWPLQAAVLALLWRLPLALELHGEPEGRFGPRLFRLVLQLPGSKRLLPITEALARSLQARYPSSLRPEQWVVAPNGVDLERYRDLPEPAEARQQLGLPERPTAGYTGHLYPGRGMGLLAALARRFPEYQFLWVGGRAQDVRAWQNRLSGDGLNNVRLTGFVENRFLPLYQAAADALLMPYETVIAGSSGGDSAAYASPMKMFEYLATGRPILSSDLPVIREVLDERVARLCPPEDVEAWAGALAELMADGAARRSLGDRARRLAARYSWRARAQKALADFPYQDRQTLP